MREKKTEKKKQVTPSCQRALGPLPTMQRCVPVQSSRQQPCERVTSSVASSEGSNSGGSGGVLASFQEHQGANING